MRTQLIIIGLSAIWLASCSKGPANQDRVQQLAAVTTYNSATSAIIPANPIDANATTLTKNLLRKLQKTSLTGVLIGHQDDQLQGVGWKYDADRSDVKSVVGEYPAVIGHELGNLEVNLTYNFGGVNFEKIKAAVKQTYRQGGVVTLLWSCSNPIDSTKTAHDTTVKKTITQLFQPGNEAYLNRYRRWMDKIAVFVKDLKGDNGEAIPIVFRTLHEQNGSWFWWGKDHCKAYEYVTMWRYTINYFQNIAGVHNLLYAYCPNSFATQADYLERYPGDNYVNVLGFDAYDLTGNISFVTKVQSMLQIIKGIAQASNKPYTLNETGLKLVPVADWWTTRFSPIIKNSGLAYALVWANVRSDAYYCAYPGQVSAPNFVTFHNDTTMYFANKAAAKKIYLP